MRFLRLPSEKEFSETGPEGRNVVDFIGTEFHFSGSKVPSPSASVQSVRPMLQPVCCSFQIDPCAEPHVTTIPVGLGERIPALSPSREKREETFPRGEVYMFRFRVLAGATPIQTRFQV